MSVWLNYHHLLYFKVIAEEGSVSKAARILRVGQPTLSSQLKQLESSLGVQLFERSHRRLTLSEHGRVALDYAHRIFSTGGEMVDALHNKTVPTRERLRIGALDSIPKQVMVQMAKFAFKLKNCQLSVIEGKVDELVRELTAHRLDLLISNFVPLASDGRVLIHRLVVKRPVAFFASKKFQHLRKNFPDSLTGQPVILPNFDSKLRYDIEDWLHKRRIIVDAVAETQDISLKKMMAVDGLSLIPAATHTVNRQVLAGELIEIGKTEGVFEELYIVRAPRKRTNSLAEQLMDGFKV